MALFDSVTSQILEIGALAQVREGHSAISAYNYTYIS